MANFPYTAFRITPSFFIEPVVLVSAARYGDHVSDKGKRYAPLGDLFETHEKAKAAALARLEDRRAKAQKTLDSVPRLLKNVNK